MTCRCLFLLHLRHCLRPRHTVQWPQTAELDRETIDKLLSSISKLNTTVVIIFFSLRTTLYSNMLTFYSFYSNMDCWLRLGVSNLLVESYPRAYNTNSSWSIQFKCRSFGRAVFFSNLNFNEKKIMEHNLHK